MKTIEYCTNTEWLTGYGPLSELGAESPWQEEAAVDWCDQLVQTIESKFPDIDLIQAQGQRSMCHGWNGANTFSHKGSGLGTFDRFTDEDWLTLEEIAREVGQGVSDRWIEKEIADEISCLRDAIEIGDETEAGETLKRLTDYHGLEPIDPRLAEFAHLLS